MNSSVAINRRFKKSLIYYCEQIVENLALFGVLALE